MRIYIIRHGDPDYALDSLTERGFKEAEILADRMDKLSITDLYCSPLGRAVATAEPTIKRTGLKSEILPWLREFTGKIEDPDNPGKMRIPWNLSPRFWLGQSEFYHKDNWIHNPYVAAGDMVDKYNMVTKHFDELLSEYGLHRKDGLYHCSENPDKNIAFFCHFGLGMILISHLANISPFLMLQNFFLPTSSVTTIVSEEREKGEIFFKCKQLGDTSHLYAAGQDVSKAGLFQEFYKVKDGLH
ncbi:MAG: histidine phosphatase family protein [Clostridiales bacterium]|nr:histidine phosphatase family protein [Clostridiales bacterium]